MKRSSMLVIPFVMFGVVGCASIMSGSTQKVSINSTPSGATVYLDGKNIGVTPLAIDVARPKSEGSQLKFEKAGFKSLEVPYGKKMNTWMLGNVIFGGTFGTSTDYATGAMFEYQPDFLQVTLEAAGTTQLEQDKNRAQNDLRHFVLTNYDLLSTQIVDGKGEYVSALLEKLAVANDGHDKVVADLKQHLVSVSEAPAFVDYVITTYSN